jgi:uncharacterized protein (TIGR03435 family)
MTKRTFAVALVAAAAAWGVIFLETPAARAQDKEDHSKMTMMQKAPPLPPGKDATAFEVATIKPAAPSDGGAKFAGRPGGLELGNFSPKALIRMAFGNLPNNRIVGGPSWLDSERYDINGQLKQGERAAPPLMYQLPLRALLAERFKFRYRMEPKEFPVYELVVARGGPRLTPNTDGVGPGGLSNPGHFTGKKLTMETFANRFPGVDRIVIDKTGLTGEYDFEFTWAPDPGSAAGVNAVPGAVSIFTAIQEQLGLRLQQGKAPLDVLVIENLEKPTEN